MGEGQGAGRMVSRTAPGSKAGASSSHQQGLEHPKPCFRLSRQGTGAAARIPAGPSSKGDQARAQEEACTLQGCPTCRERGDGATGFHRPLRKLLKLSAVPTASKELSVHSSKHAPPSSPGQQEVQREQLTGSWERFGCCELSLQETPSLPD